MDAFATEAFALLGVGLGIIALRLAARIYSVGLRGLHADDYLMVLAAGVYSAETYLAYSVEAYWHGLANNAMSDEERRLLDPASEEYRLRVNGSKTQVAGWSIYTFLLWIIKAAMCTFYLRLTDGLYNFKMRIYVGFVLILATWLAVLFSILFSCYPLEKNWQIYPDPGNFCQPAISRIDILVTVVLNFVTDLYLLSIPIPMLWHTRLPLFKKAGLMALFSGGAFVTMAGILRCVLILTDPVNGAQQAGSWACRETFVAVVTSNLPMIFPLMRRIFGPVVTSLRSYSGRNYAEGISRSERIRLEDKNPRRGMGPRSVNPITNFTFNDSEENMVAPAPPADPAVTMEQTTGTSPPPQSGIIKEVEVTVTEQRKSQGEYPGEKAFGPSTDFYLVEQQRRSEEAQKKTSRKDKRASVGRPRTGV